MNASGSGGHLGYKPTSFMCVEGREERVERKIAANKKTGIDDGAKQTRIEERGDVCNEAD